MSENTIKIFTDGACKGNPGLGGCILIIEDSMKKKFIGKFNTTNNQMSHCYRSFKVFQNLTIELHTLKI